MRGLRLQEEREEPVRRFVPALLALSLLATACGGDDTASGGASTGAVSAQVASYELVAGQPERFLIGLFTADGVVSYGSVDLSFSYLGTGSDDPQAGPETTGTFLLVPQEGAGHSHEEGDDGMDMGSDDHAAMGAVALPTDDELAAAEQKAPEITAPDQVRGVYQASDVTFADPGVWEATVTVDLDGAAQTATAAFQVVAEPAYPAPGQAAPPTDNLVMNDEDAKPSMVDSRASGGWDTVPDPELHQGTIADSIDAGRPVVVVVSTPLYCQSRFCGPITDEILALSEMYGDRADFIHLEVWRNYQDKVVNKAAADWVYRTDITEPWVFLVGPDGTIIDRWANVADPRELRDQLEALPA